MAVVSSQLEIVSGLVVDVADHDGTTELSVVSPAGEQHRIALAERVDERAADRVEAAHRRLVWQRIDVVAGEVRCTVRGVRHRLPSNRPIAAPAALALARRGLPTIARMEAP